VRIISSRDENSMNARKKAKYALQYMSFRRAAILGILIGWFLLSTVVPVPAPPGSDGGSGPG
jgi:hypothetical protein